MRVCHVTCVHNYDDGRIFYKECSSLRKAGHDVWLVAPGTTKEEYDIHVVGIGETPKSRIKRMTKFARQAYEAALKVDAEVYHMHDPELLPFAAKIKKQGKKVIFDCHENILEAMDEKTYIPKIIRGIVGKLFKVYAKRVLPKLDALISVTPAIIDQLKPINSNTWMITNYPLLRALPPGLKREPGKICFTGGVNEQWKIHDVLQAIVDIDGAKLIFCGPSTEQYLDQLKSTNGWDKSEYLGRLGKTEVEKLQQSSSIGIAMTEYRPNIFGNIGSLGITKVYEYMMNGLPVICTDLVCWKEMIDKYRCGIYVAPNDREGLINAIKKISSDNILASEMGLNSRNAAEQEFSWPSQEKILLEMYTKL